MSRIVLAGGSGFLGSHLAPLLASRGDEVVVLTRGRARVDDGVRYVHWNGTSVGPWAVELDGARAVVHLAGKRVDCRPTRRNVDELIRSRVEPVWAVGQAIGECNDPPEVWVQLSTMAIYGDTGDAVVDESVPPCGLGPRQMVSVALAWETAFRQVSHDVGRAVLLRAGIGLGGADDPAAARLRLLARLGLAGPIAGGRQWVSWIALGDLLRIVVRAIDDDRMRGLYLATAPEPVRNGEMMAAYRQLVGTPVALPAPAFVARVGAWLLGTDPQLALIGRRGHPRRLLDEGFEFAITNFGQAVRDKALARDGFGLDVTSQDD